MKHYVILNSYAASDVAMANKKLSITGAPSVDFSKLKSAKVQAAVAETAKVGTVTVSLAANTRYEFSFSQIIDGERVSGSIVFTSGAAVPTTQVTVGLRDMFNNSSFGGQKFKATAVATSNTVLTITAAAGYPLFTMTNVINTAIATTTPGVAAIGTLAKVSAEVANQTSVVGSPAASLYTTVTLVYGSEAIPQGGIKRDSGDDTLVVFLSETEGALAVTVAKLNAILRGEIAPETAVAISSSSNATPIVVTVAAVPASYTIGSLVAVNAHATNTNANGTWRVSALSATTITLEGSAGNGSGSATGTIIKVGTAVDSESVNIA